VSVTGAQIDDAMIAQHEIDYADYEGERWGIGEGVWEIANRYPPETYQNDKGRYGSAFHTFMALVTLAKLDAPQNEPLTVIVPAPPSYVSEVKPAIKLALVGEHIIRMKGDKKDRLYHIHKVIVTTEGVPAFCAYRYDINGHVVDLPSPKGYDYLSGMVEVIDIGFGTLDSFTITNGKMNADLIAHATDPDGGILMHIINPVLDEVRNLTGATHITASHVDGWLRKWIQAKYNPDAATVRVGNKTLKLHGKLDSLTSRYADWVIQTKLKPLPREITTVMESGGGWVLLDERVKTVFKRLTFLSPQQFHHLQYVPVWELNAYGSLVMLAAKRRYRQKSNS